MRELVTTLRNQTKYGPYMQLSKETVIMLLDATGVDRGMDE